MAGILNKSATVSVFKDVKVVPVLVAAGTDTTATAADPDLVGGQIRGFYPSAGAADKYVNLVSLAADGKVTVTLSGNTTADITYSVVVAVASGNLA